MKPSTIDRDHVRPEEFTIPVTDHGFVYVDDYAGIIPDDVHLGRLKAFNIALEDITVAAEYHLHPGILAEYVAQRPGRKRIIVRPWGDEQVAVVDGHHAIVAARLRGETFLRVRWMPVAETWGH